MADAIEETFLRAWKVSSPELLVETVTSQIVKVRLPDGTPAIVKALTEIGMQEELRGVHYLDWHDGNGAIRLLAQEDNLLLPDSARSSIISTNTAMRTQPQSPSMFCASC